MNDRKDDEENRLSARAARYVGSAPTSGRWRRGSRASGCSASARDDSKNAAALAAALGGLKGPIMKVAQLMATIPEALPAEYAEELSQLQSQAPPMGPAFVRRRMMAELGPEWAARFKSFEPQPAASASLGQVHRAVAHDGRALAAKLQYPDMQSAVEADLNQLKMVFALHARMNPAVDTAEILKEVSARLREELDYELEARHTALYALIFKDEPRIRVPEVLADLSTKRLLTMTWLEGRKLLDYKGAPLEDRNAIAQAMFKAWWYPFSHYGVIHGDPHLGNYTIFEQGERGRCQRRARHAGRHQPARLRLHPHVSHAVRAGRDRSLQRAAARQARPGGARLRDLGVRRPLQRADRHPEHLGALHLRAAAGRPRARDRRRHHAGRSTGARKPSPCTSSSRRRAPCGCRASSCSWTGPRSGSAACSCTCGAKLNWHNMFNETIQGFVLDEVAERQKAAFAAAGVPLPTAGD